MSQSLIRVQVATIDLREREPVKCVFCWGKFNYRLVEQQVYGNPFRNTEYFENHWLSIEVQEFLPRIKTSKRAELCYLCHFVLIEVPFLCLEIFFSLSVCNIDYLSLIRLIITNACLYHIRVNIPFFYEPMKLPFGEREQDLFLDLFNLGLF